VPGGEDDYDDGEDYDGEYEDEEDQTEQ